MVIPSESLLTSDSDMPLIMRAYQSQMMTDLISRRYGVDQGITGRQTGVETVLGSAQKGAISLLRFNFFPHFLSVFFLEPPRPH